MQKKKCDFLQFNLFFVLYLMNLNYVCVVDGVVEYASSDLNYFNHYRSVYAEEHQDANVEYLVLSDEEYERFLVEEV